MLSEKKGKKPLHEYKDAKVDGSLISHYGVDATKYNCISWLEDSIVLTSAGKFVLFVDVLSGKIETQVGPSQGGVGVVGVHPSRAFYVVGERAPSSPRMLVYSWPDKAASGFFEGGAVVGYGALDFDSTGERMVTVASAPDYTISVWDWAQRSMILRNKCFGADVFTVRFSPFDRSILTTSGAGHIKFWTMSQTFTGLKLQGTLGKFGRLEISNVSAFLQFPDGKVLSGSESGCLLIWEGDLVRCSFVKSVEVGHPNTSTNSNNNNAVDEVVLSYEPCHVGAINALYLIHNNAIVASAGDDGFIRYWKREELELAEGKGQIPMYAPRCLLEVKVGDVPLRSMTKNEKTNEWLLLSSNGCFCTSPFPSLQEIESGALSSRPVAHFLSYNGQGIVSSSICPDEHSIVTGGEDGAVRVVDYLSAIEISHMAGASLLPPLSDPVVALHVFNSNPSRVIAAYENGVLVLLEKGADSLKALGQWKPHSGDLIALAVSKDERFLCSISGNHSSVFFFQVEDGVNSLSAIGFCTLPLAAPLCVEWDEDAESDRGCLVGFESGELLSIACPSLDEVDHNVGFEFPCRYALVGIRQRKLPPPAEEDGPSMGDDLADALEEVDNGPWAVVLLTRLPNGNLAVGMRKEELVYEYRCTVRYPMRTSLPPLPPTGIEPPNYVEEPGDNLCYRSMVPVRAFTGKGHAGNELLVVCEQSKVLVRPLDLLVDASNADVTLYGEAHDSTIGSISGAFVSFDGAVLVTTGTDGMVVAQLRSGCSQPQKTLRLARNRTTTAAPSIATAAGERQKQLRSEEVSEPVPPAALSIQEQKEADDKAQVEREKQQRLDSFVRELRVLHERFGALVEENGSGSSGAATHGARELLTPAELVLDPSLKGRLEAEKRSRVEEARKEFAVSAAREDLRTRKLKNRFVDNLIHDRFVLHSFSGDFSVASFRTVDPTASINTLREWIRDAGSDSDSDEPVNNRNDKDTTRKPATSAADGHDNDHRHGDGADGSVHDGGDYQSLQSGDPQHGDGDKDDYEADHATGRTKLNVSASVKQQLDKADERRREREVRKAGYEAVMRRKPDPTDDDKLLADLVGQDEVNRGECVLRADPNYVSHKDYKPTASAKLRQMIILEETRVQKRCTFNEKLLRLREEKRGAVEEINALRSRIAVINETLGDHCVPSETISLLTEEDPESRFRVSREALDRFAREQAEAKAREEEAKKAQRGFGADLAGATSTGAPRGSGATRNSSGGASESANRRGTSLRQSSVGGAFGGNRRASRASGGGAGLRDRASRQGSMFSVANRERMDAEMKTKLENIKRSEIEEEEHEMLRQQLLLERARLDAKARSIASRLDRELLRSHFERAELDADICMADAHLLLLFREYQMLLVYGRRDAELRKQLRDVKRERELNNAEIQNGKASIAQLEQQQSSIQEQSKELKKEAEDYIHQHVPSDRVAYVLKIYNRHIKRRKNADENDDNDDITSDEDDEGEMDDGIIEEVCPPSCPVEVWEKVLAYREHRLDLSDDLGDRRADQEKARKLVEQRTKNVEALEKKFKDSQQDIVELEREKKKQLNMLNAIVPLRCGQIKCLDADADRQMPYDVQNSDVVVVDENELERLRQRIIELAVTKRERREVITSMSADLRSVQQKKQETKKLHSEWEAKVSEIMMLKFGRLVDLEMLETCGSSRRVEMRKEELRQCEIKWQREIRKSENKIADLRDRLQNRLIFNTHLLQDYGTYENDMHVVDKSLSKVTQKTVQQHQAPRVATQNDRMNLRDLICAQQEEIDALNAEILMLKRKGGHAYSPSMY